MKKTLSVALTFICIALLAGVATSGDDFKKVDTMPEMIKSTAPVYPAAAKEAGIEASLIVRAFIDKTGTVVKAEAVECSTPDQGFEKAAVDAALQCVYKPASYKGQPVGIWVSYKVDFKLDGDKK